MNFFYVIIKNNSYSRVNYLPKKATWYKINDVLVKVFESLATNVKLPALISVVVFKFCAVIGAVVFVVGGHKVFNTTVSAKFMSDCLNFGTSKKNNVKLIIIFL